MPQFFDKLKKAYNDIKQEASAAGGFPGQHQQRHQLPPQYYNRQNVPPPAALSVPPVASRAEPSEPIRPKVKGQPQLIGLANDPRLNRDSGCSVRLGSRVLWVYRDTQFTNPDGSIRGIPIICNTASWSDYHPNGQPVLQSIHPQADAFRETALYQYGGPMDQESFFSLRHYDCHPAGNRDDGTRIVIWPDCPPIVTSTNPSTGEITAYSWIRRSHITNTLGVVVENPATALYKLTYHPAHHTGDILPSVELVNKTFWPENAIPFGVYGTVLSRDKSTVYLYGQTGQGMHVRTSLARVAVQHVEDVSQYEYWVGNQWTKERPSLNQDGTWLIDCNIGGQGTYYFSEVWGCYVWIGGGPFPGPSFHITTALKPEGPWIQPYKFFEAENGTADLGAYSLQAHPDLNADPNDNAVYLTYTKNDKRRDGTTAYSTPLYRVEWE